MEGICDGAVIELLHRLNEPNENLCARSPLYAESLRRYSCLFQMEAYLRKSRTRNEKRRRKLLEQRLMEDGKGWRIMICLDEPWDFLCVS